jgi:hypothetical protein
MTQEQRPGQQSMLICLIAGLAFVAAVPGIGWLWGQFVETISLCIGGALLVYAALAYMADVNVRLTALEQSLAEKSRSKS